MAPAANAVHGGGEVERKLILGGIFNPLPLDCGTNARVFRIEVDQGDWDVLSYFAHGSVPPA